MALQQNLVSITALQLLTAAAEELEVLDSGGSLTANEQASGLLRIQMMIDSANAQKPTIFSERLDSVTLTASQQSYTIGIDPTGAHTADFSIPRPVKIERANLFLTSSVRRPVKIWDFKKWATIRYQNVLGPPIEMYYDGGFGTGSASGFGTINFYLIPDQNYAFEFYSWQQNTNITALTDVLNYPPGYAEFWLYSTVMRVASMFGRAPTAAHMELLSDARERVSALNCPSPELRTGGDLAHGERGLYNWLTGEIES